MDIQVIEKNEIKVVGISWNGSYSKANVIPELFKVMEARLEEVPNQTEETVLIAPFHSRETEFTYYVTTPVDKIEKIPEGMVGFTIPSKNYVFATHKGRTEEVENTYLKIFSWMEEYGYEQDHQALSIEVYQDGNKESSSSDLLNFEILIPIKTYNE